MKQFFFDTGVKPQVSPHLFEDEVWLRGTKQIPFYCEDVPDDSIFMFACDNPNLPESLSKNVIVRKIHQSSMTGYAYFRLSPFAVDQEDSGEFSPDNLLMLSL